MTRTQSPPHHSIPTPPPQQPQFQHEPLATCPIKQLCQLNKLCRNDEKFIRQLNAQKAMFVLTDPHQHDHPIVFASEAFCLFTGYGRCEVEGRNCRFLQHPPVSPVQQLDAGDQSLEFQKECALNRVRTVLALESKEPISVCLSNFKKDGTPFLNHFFLKALTNRKGKVVKFVGVQQEITNTVTGNLKLTSTTSISKRDHNNSLLPSNAHRLWLRLVSIRPQSLPTRMRDQSTQTCGPGCGGADKSSSTSTRSPLPRLRNLNPLRLSTASEPHLAQCSTELEDGFASD
eukprot:c1148_g1_i1.p1 GENE.c1148_g1_i1~~c1148_g1_i1.p1  ORF type:complete len:288 (-),score=73.03 c1148_g1_i1:179-1042(-)